MACYSPLSGYRGEGGKVVFAPQDQVHAIDGKSQFLTVPCGQCMGCRLERSRQWAVRCMHELRSHDEAIFATLTYEDAQLPENQSLDNTHLQKFFKRLRKSIDPVKIRYFACGEYGSKTDRPHYHAIIYGYAPDDARAITSTLSTSPKLTKIWSHGHVVYGDVTFESCAYVAGYITDKLTGDAGYKAYEAKGRKAPYVVMSRRPGIAAEWFSKFKSDIFPLDELVIDRDGQKILTKPPKYYDKLYEKISPDDLRRVKALRELRANTPAARKRVSPERLYARQEIQHQKQKDRNLKKLEI